MNIKVNTQLFNKQGQLISLAKEIGHGGEGSIYETKELSNLVAKIYHKPVDPKKAEKLSLMVNLKTERLSKISAWPLDTLYEKPGGNLIGFLMEKVTGYKEIHNLYSPKSRLTTFPEAYWQFLIHAATNVARAFNAIHEHGHVIADVNHANILISKEATAFLIDCDSFQINTTERKFLCEVGTPTHTPPELQDKPFRDVVRTQNHDLFGLSIIIFQLLFMGRHPFSGKYLGSEDMPLERAIKEYRFAYSSNTHLTKMSQPPATLSLSSLPQSLIQLFEQSFSKSSSRPTAKDWITTLGDMAISLKKCESNSSHLFYKNLQFCPWCDIEAKSGIYFFNIQVSGVFQPFKSSSNIARLWLELQAIQLPESLPQIPSKNSITVSPSAKTESIKNAIQIKKKKHKNFSIIVIPVFVVITYITLNFFLFLIVTILLIVMLDFMSITNTNPEIIKLKKAKEDIEQKLENLSKQLGEIGEKDFSSKKHEIEKKHENYKSQFEQKKREYDNLAIVRKQKLEQMEKDNRENQRVYQFNNFLDKHRIVDAKIPSIGKARTATLQSYGIETAADIDRWKIKSIPGFGTSYTSNLLYWRQSVEAKFRFDPTKIQSIPQTRIATLDKEIKENQLKLQKEILRIETQHEKELSDAIRMLIEINQKTQQNHKSYFPSIVENLHSLVQIETDLNFIGVLNDASGLSKIARNPAIVLSIIILLLFAFLIDYSNKMQIQRQQEFETAKHLQELEIQKSKQEAYQNKIKLQLLELGDDSKTVKEIFGNPDKIITTNLAETEIKQEEMWKYFPYKKTHLLRIGFVNDKIIGWVDKRESKEKYGVSKEIIDSAKKTIDECVNIQNTLTEYSKILYTWPIDQNLATKLTQIKNTSIDTLFLSYNQELLPTKLANLQKYLFSAKQQLQQSANKMDERIHLPYLTQYLTLYTSEQNDHMQKLENGINSSNELAMKSISEAILIFKEFENSSNSATNNSK